MLTTVVRVLTTVVRVLTTVVRVLTTVVRVTSRGLAPAQDFRTRHVFLLVGKSHWCFLCSGVGLFPSASPSSFFVLFLDHVCVWPSWFTGRTETIVYLSPSSACRQSIPLIIPNQSFASCVDCVWCQYIMTPMGGCKYRLTRVISETSHYCISCCSIYTFLIVSLHHLLLYQHIYETYLISSFAVFWTHF